MHLYSVFSNSTNRSLPLSIPISVHNFLKQKIKIRLKYNAENFVRQDCDVVSAVIVGFGININLSETVKLSIRNHYFPLIDDKVRTLLI